MKLSILQYLWDCMSADEKDETSKSIWEHRCSYIPVCICWITATEPHSDCPAHICDPWPYRCNECGRFVSYKGVAVND